MLDAFTKIFIKEPTVEIAGVALTHEEAIQLAQTCTSLKYNLDTQLDAIPMLPVTPRKAIVSEIRLIQTRHGDIQACLATLALKARRSREPWAHEFVNAHTSLERKVVCINRRSRRWGWLVTARQYWPDCLETYVWLMPLVVRLQSDLRDALRRGELWTADIPQQMRHNTNTRPEVSATICTDRPHVMFKQRVIVREYRVGQTIDEASLGEAYAAKLTDDKTTTAGKFQRMKATCKGQLDTVSD